VFWNNRVYRGAFMSGGVERGGWHFSTAGGMRNRAGERNAGLLGTAQMFQTGLGPGPLGGPPRTLLSSGQNNLVYSPRDVTDGGGPSRLMLRAEEDELRRVAASHADAHADAVGELGGFDRRLEVCLSARPRLADPSLQGIEWAPPPPLQAGTSGVGGPLLAPPPARSSLRRASRGSSAGGAEATPRRHAALLASDMPHSSRMAGDAAHGIAQILGPARYSEDVPFVTKLLTRPSARHEPAPAPAPAPAGPAPPGSPRRSPSKTKTKRSRRGSAAFAGSSPAAAASSAAGSAASSAASRGEAAATDPRLVSQLECLASLDGRLQAHFGKGTVRLLAADFVRMGFLDRILTRQELERMEHDDGERRARAGLE
jgi:hypothetical protein